MTICMKFSFALSDEINYNLNDNFHSESSFALISRKSSFWIGLSETKIIADRLSFVHE